MKKIVLLHSILMILLIPAICSGEDVRLNIIYTGSMNGELEPCGCSPKTDFGGLARLSGYLIEHSEELSEYVLIDAGNFSLKDTPQGRLKANAMLKAFTIMKYDAVALQKNERIFPVNFFHDLLDDYKLPSVSGINGHSMTVSAKRNNLVINISVDPDDLKKDKLNILLTDISISECKTIKGWDLIINSSGELLEEPLKTDETIIISGYPKGERLGILTLQIDKKGRPGAFKHMWQPLGSDIHEDMRVRDILNDYDVKVAKLLEDAEYISPETTYLGISKCAECHQLFVESWENTRHAGAFSSLEEAGKSSDPECLICHTVGFGEEGGFFSIKTTPGLANVQCEVCHGLDKEHISDYSRPMKPVTESICIKCHTAENSPDFNYSDYFDKIKH